MIFQSAELGNLQFWTTQILVTQEVTTSKDAIALSGSQGFLVLIAGVLLAFAFQLLLSNFFIALGISYSDSEDQLDNESDSLDDKITKSGIVVRLRTLGTISITLFLGCFLAVKLSLVHDEFMVQFLGF